LRKQCGEGALRETVRQDGVYWRAPQFVSLILVVSLLRVLCVNWSDFVFLGVLLKKAKV
jgi:hypothetical protein